MAIVLLIYNLLVNQSGVLPPSALEVLAVLLLDLVLAGPTCLLLVTHPYTNPPTQAHPS
jgi:hypothetical protein